MTAEKFPPKDAEQIVEKLASRGCNQRTISKALGIGFDLWVEWRDEKYPELKEALEKGRAVEHDQLVGKLFDCAVNGTGKESITAAIFLLKTRHGYRENEPLDQGGPQINLTFELPGSVDVKTYEAQVLKKAIEPGKGKKDNGGK